MVADFLPRITMASVLSSTLMLVACSEAPRELSLQLLANEQSTVDGNLVITQGRVQHFEDPLHYWLEDNALNRVALHPNDAVAQFDGEYVQVEGRFFADRERGRRIEVDDIRPVQAPAR